MEYTICGTVLSLCAIVSAKLALELGYSQLRQASCGPGGLLLGPVMPFILYVRLLNGYRAERRPGGAWF